MEKDNNNVLWENEIEANKLMATALVIMAMFFAVLSVTSLILGDLLMSMVDPRISFSSKAR